MLQLIFKHSLNIFTQLSSKLAQTNILAVVALYSKTGGKKWQAWLYQ